MSLVHQMLQYPVTLRTESYSSFHVGKVQLFMVVTLRHLMNRIL